MSCAQQLCRRAISFTLNFDEQVMAFDTYSDQFVDKDGKVLTGVQVYESCIDSAEYIIRQIATKGARLTRGKTGPDMMAEFLGLSFNASTVEFLKEDYTLHDYKFADLPEVGQGLILLNKTGSDLKYNMHLGAVLARSPGKAIVSHMFQHVRSFTQKPLIVLEITSAADFATKTFGTSAKCFAAGLLTPKV
jgi:hypothetical protein